MAEKKKGKTETKVVLERVYNIPLRKEFQKAPKWKRTPKAVRAVKAFVVKHMKSDNIAIGKYLNLELWKHGIKNPPHHIKVDCKKDSSGKIVIEIVGAPVEKKVEKKEKKKEVKKEAEVKEEKKIEVKDEKQEESKKREKEELKEIKKEKPKVHAPKEAAKPKDLHLRKKEMIPGR